MQNLINMLNMVVDCLQIVLLHDPPNIVTNQEKNKVFIMVVEINIKGMSIIMKRTKDIHTIINITIHIMTDIRIAIGAKIMGINIAIIQAEWLRENLVMKRVKIILNPVNKA